MKIQLFPFSRDLRSDQQRAQYATIEQRRADAWLAIGTAYRTRTMIFRRYADIALLRRQAD